MRTPARLLLAAALVALPVTLLAQPFDMGTEPYTLEGIVAKDQASAQDAGWFPMSVGIVGSDKDAGALDRRDGVQDLERRPVRRTPGRCANLMPADPTLLFAGPPA